MSDKKEVKNITVGKILGWFFGVILVILGLTGISDMPGLSIFSIIVGLLLIPYIDNILKDKMSINIGGGVKIILFIVVIVLMSSNSVTDEIDNSKINNPILTDVVDNKNIEIKTEKIYFMNEEIEVDYLSYTIEKVETFTKMGSSFMSEETEGKFVKVYLKILNNAKETKQIFTPRFKIEDSQERSYDRLTDDMLYISDYLEFGIQLQPGLTTSGAIVFELPKDSNDLNLIINGDFISISEVKVKLDNISDIGEDTTQQDQQDEIMDDAMVDAQAQMDDLLSNY